MTSLIEAAAVSAGFAGGTVLRDVDFHIDPGEIVTVVGPNGSGKSTLLRLLVGAIPPRGGRITRRPDLRVGYVPQRLSIDPTLPLTVSRFLDLPRPADRAEKLALMDRVGIRPLAAHPLTGLSGGQYQRALLARALLTRPNLLILDEATQGMDQRGSAEFYALIEALRAETGAAVLMVSHELHVVMSASDRVVCLNGHVCCEGTPEIVRSAPEYRALFGTGTHGALALYRHEHDHSHEHHHHHHQQHDERGTGT
ncbi:zinc ABC transporter, ATP-binding protein [Pseudooceanicola batsensis HTCC2597]|uniref:Zinc ABC transporter, ATP-binding protein n=1 Tax=Pseudooceanicola batsensis (strain ATCC BAA-863 / DSM 15984 / KCTC 12145 / HTCC2597) TaxID=252305 RepID=A3U259_PSEBH|nr:metal ABC transporter ATP-binding protein [Pseudooceanicola batsensis]EAQ01659.1 zinc ABC transporter, ATP-binding protein [Pseudooceanicola batsensis HTCC2597]